MSADSVPTTRSFNFSSPSREHVKLKAGIHAAGALLVSSESLATQVPPYRRVDQVEERKFQTVQNEGIRPAAPDPEDVYIYIYTRKAN
jgi:hypothetical protein